MKKCRGMYMSEMKNDNLSAHLIDDTGVHKSNKKVHVTVFVVLCRIVTLILIVLGAAALFIGNK